MRTAYKGTNRLWMLLIAMLLVCGMAFGAIAEEGAAQTGTNDLDGSKIEGVKVIWVTQDSATTAEGTATPQAELDQKDHLYLSTVSNSEMEMVYRIEAEFSGQYDYAPGDITITIPAQVWHARKYEETGVEGETVGVVDEERLLGYLELPVPAAPSKKADFNWQIIDGNYVLTNTRTIGATSSVSIEVGIRGIRPVDVVDMSETAPIMAHVEVVTNQGNTIELTSTPIVAQLDTQARITSAYKDGEVFEDYPGLSDKLLANLPAGAKPEDYIYVRWYTYHSHNNNQPYSLDIADVLSDAYEKVSDGNGGTTEQHVTDGIFLGSTNYEGQVLTDGEIDFTAEIGDHFTTTTTGTQYANTVYMWSAYKKSDFYVPNANEAPRVYYFENEVTWTLTETDKTVVDSGNDKGEDPQKITTKTDEVILPYAPVKWQRPRGAFAVNKWTERVTHKDWLYGYALNLLESRDEVDMDFIVETVGYGYPWTSKLTQGYEYDELNNTVVNGTLEELALDASAFGKLGWKQVTDDFQTFFNFETEPLTSEDFEFKSLRVSVPGKMRYAKKSNGTWDYVSDSTLPNPDLVIEYQLNNEDTWYPAATATWGEDGLGEFKFVNVADGVTTSGMTVFFPENVTDTRHTFISNVFGGKMAEHCDIAMLDWYVYPTITMKSSDRVYGIVQELFEQSENPSTKFRNDVIMDAYGWVDANGNETLVLDNDYDYSMATYEGASYGVALNKSATSESDAENQRLVIHYTATLTEQSNLKERSDYDAAVEAGVIPAETSGIWYDLLPPHVVPLLDTVKLRKDDTITNVYTVEDYKGTGRTLLVVEAELTPVPASYNSIGYADRPRLEFDAAYTWMDMDEYGKELVNYVAFESTVENLRNDTLGTIKNQKGDPDTPAGGNNANTPSMPEDIIKALTDLDPNTDENRFVYGKYSHTVSSLTYAVSGLQKAVKNDLVGIWTQGLDGQEQVTVYEGHFYTYSLRVSSAENTATKGIVIYDTIENYIIPDPTADKDTDATKAADFAHTQERKDWSGDWQGKGQWRGTLTQVDLSEFVNAGVKPVLLYSTIDNLQFADSSSESTDDNFDEDTELFSSGSYDITDRTIWQVAELDDNGVWHVPEGLAVTAVAIDATTTMGGEEFVLRPEEALAGYLKMRAPDDDSDDNTWNAKGAYARMADDQGAIDWEAATNPANNMYAYNNARVRLIQGQANEGGTNWLSNLRMIRNDYTRVGIVPEIVTVEKSWQDQNDHDAMRPESVTIHVLRRLAGTAGEAQPVLDKDGQPLTAVLDESNGWKAEFKQVDIVNEDGVRYLYTFEEGPVEGYTSKVQFIDVNHYTMTNVHPNEQVDVSGEKTWSDDNNALGFRPAAVTLKLYRDGEHIDTRTVKANGAGEWKYTFGKLDKYAEGGKEYVYKVEEEYVPKYVGEANGYAMVNNTYIPVGDLEVSKTLVGATAAAKEQAFTFTLVLLAEQTDPNAPAVPLMDKYAYTIYTLEGEDWVAGETGEIGNSGTFTLKENQKIVVHDLPSEATYEVIESEAAGFTSTATGADGSIRAGQTVQAAFVNEYKASGSVQLNVGKSLTGHAIRKNQFRFELVDMNEDSSTYGEVIRTARVEAPEEGTTTGGSGVEIESLTQAIFGQLEYTQADHGQTYNYQVREVDTGKPGYTADAKVYDVAVSVTDNGDGTMTVIPTYTDTAGDAVAELEFENEYHAEGELTLKAWKTLEGRELKEDEFTFELYSYDAANNGLGELLDTATNDAEGNIVFDALHFDENSVSLDENNPATYTYLIREKQGTDKTVAYSNQEFVMTVTVFDNGDGTLSFAQGSQGYEREYVDCSKCAGTGAERVDVTWLSYNLVHYTFLSGTSSTRKYGENPSFRLADLKEHLCKECGGFAAGNANACGHCHGIGLEVTYLENGEYENSVGEGWVLANTDHTAHYKISKITLCTLCEGTKIEPGAMTITGDVTIPVFANELKPGDLTVTKQVQGEGSSNPDQTFNFTIKLTGEVPEKLDYGFGGAEATATPAPAPAAKATPRPITQPVVKDHIEPTVQQVTVDTTKYYHATEAELAGQAYAARNYKSGHEDANKLVFFRSDSTNPTDPWGNSFTPPTDRTIDSTNRIIYYLVDETATSMDGNWPWYTDRSNITSIEVRDAIKPATMKKFFYGMNKVTSADLSKLDTSSATDMSNMFYNCTALTAIDLSTLDTSNVMDMSYMFGSCRFKSLDLSNLDTSSVTNMSHMFDSCSSLTSLELSLDTGSVTDMSYMFNICQGLTSLKLNLDTSSVTNMKYMFRECNKLTELDLRSFDTSSVTDMSYMFYRCLRLTELDLSSFDTSSVTNMSNMFHTCLDLATLDLSTFNTSSVTNMSSMFYSFNGTAALDLSSFDTSSATNMSSMFYNSSMTEIDLSTFDTSSVTNMGSMFSSSNLTEIDLSTFDTSSVTNMNSMFSSCDGLTKLDLSTFDTSSVTSMDYMFNYSENLTSVDVSSFNTSNVTTMYQMFKYCDSLTELDLSSFDVSNVKYFYEMFRFCRSLTTLDLSSFEVSATADVQWMLMDVPKLQFVDLHGFPDMSDNTDSAAILCRSDAIEKVILGEDTAFASTSSYNYPEPPTTAPYDGTWLNIETGETIDSSKALFEEGGHPGTWIWNKPHYTVIFNSGEGVGSSGVGSTVKELVFVDEGITKSLPFYNFGYDLVAFADESGTEYPYTNGAVTIPANAYEDGSTVTLTAVWEKRDVTVSETGDSITFALKAGETFTLSDLPASLAYEVWEELPTGWVLVEKKDDTGVIKPLETSEAVFTNAYQPEKAQAILRASKLLDGKAPAGEFSFTLSEGDTTIETVQNNGSGVVFKTIEYTEVGTHSYTIAEVKGDDTTINYDAAVYTVTVEVTDDGQGNLSAEVTYLDADGKELTEPPVFKNTTKPGALTISKAIIGATEKAEKQKFTFEVTFTDELMQGWNGTLKMGEGTLEVKDGKAEITLLGGESINLEDIPAGLKYEVKETGSYPGWTLMRMERPSGTIAAAQTVESKLQNAYFLSGQASIEVKKELLGRDLTKDEFTFKILDQDGNVVENKDRLAVTATNGADGSVLFPQMTYTEEGTWKYVIVEVPGEDSTVDYSEQRINVTVTTKDEKGDGTLTTTVTYSPEEKTFTNTLKPGALEISKTVDSSNPDHAEKVFTFTVTLTDKEGKAVSGTFGNHTFDANGQCKIALKGGETETISKLPAGTQYSVTEAEEAGFTTEMTGDSGVIMPNETAYAVFTNAYAAEGEYAVEGFKTLKGADLATEQFTFELTMPQADGSETVLETVTNDADGKITFSKLIFTNLDEGEYVYRIREVNDRKPGFTYDDTVYEFTLIVKDNSDGTMTITPEGLPEGGIEFKNTYNDKTNISVEKAWADEENKLGVRPVSVTVELYRNGEKKDEVVLNTGNTWKHTFSELPAFDENGVTYTYTVKELPVTGYDGMQSVKDGVNVFTNTVQGVLDVTKTVVAGMDAEKEFAFTVTLAKADAPLTTEVILERADMREAVKPDAEGKVRFTLKDGETARLIGLPIGTEYKVEEATEAGYTTTMENAEGLIQRYEEHTAAFTNTYAATGEITFEGIKTLSGRKMTDKDIFTFEVSENGTTNTWTVQNGADGKITYPTIEYIHNAEKSDLGEHTYTVKETSEDGNGITVATNSYTVTVTVSDNGDGTLDVVASGNHKALNFTNTYEAKGNVTFEGTKTIDGRKMTDKDIFTFSITEQVAEGKTGFTGTATNDATGKISYPKIEYTLADVGDHTYTVKETSMDGKGITVSKETYTVTVTVTDNGDGTLKVVATDNAKALNFTNTYEAKGKVDFSGLKKLEGRELKEGEFSFILLDKDGKEIETVKNGKEGKIAFTTLEYIHNAKQSDLGEHTYTVKEVKGDLGGVTYDETVYTIKVTVTDNGDGTLKVVASDNAKALNFTNTYEAKGKVDFTGLKKLEGRELKEGEFSFILLDKDGKEIETVKNSKDGKITFTTLEYIHNAKQSDLGEHTYTVKEVRGDLDGVTYDETTYEIKVTVTDNGDGTLEVVASDNAKALNFTNTYEAKGKVDFTGLKKLEGRELKEGEFSFILLDKDGKEIETVKNGKEGKIAFTTLNYIHNAKQSDLGEHTYTVKEVKGELGGVTYDETAYEVTVTVTDNGDGTLEVVASDNATALNFTNTYEAKGKVEFTGLKTLEGRELKEGEFSFILLDENGKEIETVKNGKDGKITFTTLEYIHNAKQSDLGEHTYTVKEVKGELGGVTYDETTYEIKVTVTDNGDGTLEVVASDNHKALNFTNTYEAKGKADFTGLKKLEGRELKEGEFSFILQDEDGKGIETVKNSKDGKITFTTLEYIHNAKQSDLGEHTYTVKEVLGDLDGVTYDETAYEIKVTVTDNGDGTLKVVASDNATALNFTNTYEAKGKVDFTGLKKLEGRELKEGEFSFILLDKDGKEIETVKNSKDGEITFTTLNYIHNAKQSDLGEHTYTVKEVLGDLDGVTYDETTYEIKVTVTDNGDGTLKVVASDNHKALNFTNTYEADGTVRFKGTKQLVSREFRSGDAFLFELVENGVTIQRSRLTPVEGTEAAFEFNPIEYTTEDIGTHTYLIREEKGSLKGVTYDATEYTVTVTVADAGNGKLSVSKAYTVDGETAEKVLFTNIYEATGELTLTAEKTVNGIEPTADQVFDFTLSDADGEIEMVQNKLGEIEFAKLTYTLDDLSEHVYTVKENKTDKAGYAIDETVYTVKVNVTDNGDGTLKVEKKITANGKPAQSMIFDNKHSATLTISKKVEGCTTAETFPIKVWLFDAKDNELKGEYAYTGDVTGKLTSGEAIELGHGQTITIEDLPVGSRYKVEETKDPRFTTTVNSLAMNTAEGEIVEGGNTAAFVNELITTEFKVWKEWRGGEGGKIRLTLYANGEKLDPQPEYENNGNLYKYTELPKFDEDGDEIIYTAKEKYMDGYLTIYNNVSPYETVTDVIHNGGTIINKAVMDFKVQKVWSGVEEGAEVPEITLILYCNGEVYEHATPKADSEGWYHYRELPIFVNGERAVYSVTEVPMEGCSTIYTNNGEEGDCAYNGGVITNVVVPKTGDDAPVTLWVATMLLSAAALVLMARRRNV